MKGSEAEPLPYFINKVSAKWIKDVSVRPETKNLLKEKISNNFFSISLGDDFLDLTPKAKKVKVKNKQVRLHQTKKLLPSQGNHQQNEKATYQMGDNNCNKIKIKKYIW